MRYEDWDVLLFPRDCKVPLREFQVACHVVQDLEFSHTHSSAGVPTVCSFIPSLIAGTPFQVSLHSWTGIPHSQAAQAYSSFSDSLRFEARLFIDGRLVASSVLDDNTTWPHVFTHSYGMAKSGESEVLGFPTFRHELLSQTHWSPADNLGRIKLVISEGFLRNSVSNPIERVQNIVAFSFQHAPLNVLESSSIAWPSQSMWQRAPFAASLLEHTLPTRQCEIHDRSEMAWRGDHPSNASAATLDPAEEENCLGLGLVEGSAQPCSPWDLPERRYISSSFQNEDEISGTSSKAPSNTTTATVNPSTDSEATSMDFMPRGNLVPSAFARSLTQSILNQPPPLQVHCMDSGSHLQAVRSRKENNGQLQRVNAPPPAISPATGTIAEPQPVRRVSQALSHASTTSVISGSTGGASLEDDIALSSTNSPLHLVAQNRLQSQAGFDLEHGTELPEDAVLGSALVASSGNSMNKGLKRSRNFTPGLSKALDEENEHRRVSPRLDSSSTHGGTNRGDLRDC